MTLPTSRATANEAHASRLAYALARLIKAGGMDESTSHLFAAVTEASRALQAYANDNPAFTE